VRRRILHVVGAMRRAGLESWLVNVLRRVDRDGLRMDFLVHTDEPGDYDDEVRALGAKLIPCLHPRRPVTYARAFGKCMREHGPYDVVHSHVDHFSGCVLRLAARHGVPVRIVHSHSDTSKVDRRAALRRRLYLRLMRRWIRVHATAGLAASREAATALFGDDWRQDPRWRILHCGIDLGPYRAQVDAAAVRRELAIPSDAFVLGHVGRFHEPKNHDLLVQIAAQVVHGDPRTWLLLVGDGPLLPRVRAQARELGILDRIVFAGSRADVPRLLKGAMDVFLLPSLYEGLPLVLLEAQAAGLPCLISDVITTEADVVPRLVRRTPLSAPAWADALAVVRGESPARRERAWASLEQGPFDIDVSVLELERQYETLTATLSGACRPQDACPRGGA